MITAQGRVQFAKQWADFLCGGDVVAIMFDEIPEGEGKAIVEVRTGRQIPAGRDDREVAKGKISSQIEIEREPAFRWFAHKRGGCGHSCDNGRGHKMNQHIAAVSDDFRIVGTSQTEAACNSK